MKSDKKLNVELNGIVPSLHTPFNNDKSIDFFSLKKLVDHTINANCSGMLIGAVAGETQSLTSEEKIRLMEFVLTYVDHKIPVIVGCSASSQEERLELSKSAKSLGARWFLVQSPIISSKNKLLDCFHEISETGPENLMIQDLSWFDNGLSDEIILNLFKEISNFEALKIEVINSGPKYSRVLNITNNKLHLSGGWAVMGIIDSIKRGVHSFIPSTMERIYNKIYNLSILGNYEEARILFNSILPAISFSHQNIDVSIKFYKMLRVRENLFNTSLCRDGIKEFDEFQMQEANLLIDQIIKIQNK